MTEELALKERLDDGAHVDRHERPPAACGEAVQLAGQHALAGAVLARDEHIGIRGGDTLDEGAELLHGGRCAPADGVLHGGRGWGALLGGGDMGAIGLGEGVDEALIIPRLDDEIRRALLYATHGEVNIRVGGEQHHRGCGA